VVLTGRGPGAMATFEFGPIDRRVDLVFLPFGPRWPIGCASWPSISAVTERRLSAPIFTDEPTGTTSVTISWPCSPPWT
jgi:hypothetical protein